MRVRSLVFVALAMAWGLMGCAAQQADLLPDREAVYDQPLEEIWPEVRQFFTDNKLPFREDRGSYVLQTEWREEFGGSKIAGYWHRYMVLGKRETPSKGKLWVIRITKSANKALSTAGKELDWGITRASGGSNELSPEDWEDRFDAPRGENSFYAESGQGNRDMVMEWRVFRAVAPKLAKTTPEPVKVAPTAEAAPKARLDQVSIECGLPILGLAKQVKKGGVLLLGEMPGTQEVPRFLAQAACQAAASGVAVTVGLELPAENQERVERYLSSPGAEEDWLKLMEAPFWRSPYPDGRSSESVANMLEQLRRLRAQGLDVEAFVFDHPAKQGQEREDAMAATVLDAVTLAPDRFFLVLTGNIHPRTVQGLPWDAKYRPMGLLLARRLPDVRALDMAYDSGSVWLCAVDEKGVKNTLDCGIRKAKGKDNGDRFFVHLWNSPNKDGYHGVFYVGAVNASAPAVMKGLGNPGARDELHRLVTDEGPALASSH